MWFNDRSEDHVNMVQLQIFHWGRWTRPRVLWCVNWTAPKSLWKHTGGWCVYVCLCIMKHNRSNWSAHMLSRMLEQYGLDLCTPTPQVSFVPTTVSLPSSHFEMPVKSKGGQTATTKYMTFFFCLLLYAHVCIFSTLSNSSIRNRIIST